MILADLVVLEGDSFPGGQEGAYLAEQAPGC